MSNSLFIEKNSYYSLRKECNNSKDYFYVQSINYFDPVLGWENLEDDRDCRDVNGEIVNYKKEDEDTLKYTVFSSWENGIVNLNQFQLNNFEKITDVEEVKRIIKIFGIM